MVKKSDGTIIRFELWNKKGGVSRVIVARKDGKIKSWRYQKNSGIKTKINAKKIFKETNNFYIDRIRVKSQFKSKVVKVPKKRFFKQLGKNTGLIITKQPLDKNTNYQYVARVKWGDKERETKGYSDQYKNGGSKEQAFNRAKGLAISLKIDGLSYDYDIQWVNSNTGFAVKGKKAIFFNVSYEVQTFIQTRPLEIKTK